MGGRGGWPVPCFFMEEFAFDFCKGIGRPTKSCLSAGLLLLWSFLFQIPFLLGKLIALKWVSLTGVDYNRYLLEETWVLSYLAVVILTALYSSSYFSSVHACEIANEILERTWGGWVYVLRYWIFFTLSLCYCAQPWNKPFLKYTEMKGRCKKCNTEQCSLGCRQACEDA